MFPPFRRRKADVTLLELGHLPHSYPPGTPGRMFLGLNKSEALILIRGVREAARAFTSALDTLTLSAGHASGPASPLIETITPLRDLRQQFDYERHTEDDLMPLAAEIYAQPLNADLSLVEVLTQAVTGETGLHPRVARLWRRPA